MTSTAKTRAWRLGLIGLGLLLLLVGGITFLNDVNPKRYLGVAVWIGGAILLHDGIVAPAMFGINVLLRKAGRRLPAAVLIIVQAAIIVGALVSLLVIPEIVKKQIGTKNPTILPLDYSMNLLVFYVVMAVVTGLAIAVYLRVAARRQNVRPSIPQN